MSENNFMPVLRFMVCSDVHYKDEHTVERDRMVKAIKKAYELSENEAYNKLDAIYVVGDFANSGSRAQMEAFKATLDENVKEGTVWNLSLASHEYFHDGEENALKRFDVIFKQDVNTHRVINGFHFISVSCTRGCHFDEPQRKFALEELRKATKDNHKAPVFFFQHPHVQDTVYGSQAWGEDELYDILCNFPQVIDFSGHSHAPINDPRSIHQKHFTCLGTGSLSYFENDEFDKCYGTCFPGKEKCAQMLLVEADKDGRVRIYPYDLITDNFFPYVWKIDEAWNPQSYIYTDARYKTDIAPEFSEDAKINVSDITEDGITVAFTQAQIEKDYVDDYNVCVMYKDGTIAQKKNIWSEYYFYDMPETLSVSFDWLEKGEYYIEIYANSFWKTTCKKPLRSEIFSL